ncbi:hypothetical protein ABZU75_03050 [Streptosporangium sp. NPDC005286]
MDLTAGFAAPPEFTVLHGSVEIGRTDHGLPTSGLSTSGTRRWTTGR